jgi:hypothetical protein
MRALMAVGVIALLSLVLYFTAACTKPVATGVTRQDSAGVEIVTISAGAIAAAPVWTVDTSTALWTIGGGEDPTQDIDRMTSVGRLSNGNVVVCVGDPAEVRLYPSNGTAARTLARAGDGPGEFRIPILLAVRGDTIVLWDLRLKRLTRLTTSGTLVQTVSYASLPRVRVGGIAGFLDDGRIVTSGENWEAMSDVGSKGVRKEKPVYLLHQDGLGADSLAGPPGMLLYMGVVREGGKSFSTPTSYELDGGTPLRARPAGYTIALPDSPELREHDTTGTVRRIIRPDVEMREVTAAFKERYIAHDSVQVTRSSPQFAADRIQSLREGRFVDRLAAFERIYAGPDGDQWFERSWVSMDTVKQFVIFDSTGMVAGQVTIPMSRTIGWIGTDAVLTTWLDEDGVRHLSLNPLRRAPQ